MDTSATSQALAEFAMLRKLPLFERFGFAAPRKSGRLTFTKARRRLQDCDSRGGHALAIALLKEAWFTVAYRHAIRSKSSWCR
jgi:hypothetical protein